jgi:hypothetical protein
MNFLLWGNRAAPQFVTAINPLPILANFAAGMLDGAGILKVNPGIYRIAPTQSAKTVGTGAATLLASNANRSYLLIQSQDDANPIYINFGGTAGANNGSLRLPPLGSYELTGSGTVFTSAISAIATGAPVLCNVIEGS